jgi:hypothetical protein
MHNLLRGCAAGLIATAPMTWTMRAAERLVPVHGKHWGGKLPPRQITERILHVAGLRDGLDENERTAAAIAAHYAFGTAAGGLLGLVATRQGAVPRPLCGAAIGMLVWAASYMGILPAANIRRTAAQEPVGRNIQMIAAHLVWGGVAGVLLDGLDRDSRGGV